MMIEHLKAQFPAGPKGMPILGVVSKISKQGMVDFYYSVWKEYGDIAHMMAGPLHQFLLVRPDDIHHVMVKNADNYMKLTSHAKLRAILGNGLLPTEGDTLWRRQRKLMQPTYTPNGIRQFADIMVDAGEQLTAKWHQKYADGKPFDLNLAMLEVTMSIISRSMFGIDISDDFAETGHALIELLEYVSNTASSIFDVPLFVPTRRNVRVKQAKEHIDAYIMGIIQTRRKEGLGNDLLSMLMSAKDEETGEMMTDEQLRDEVLITFFAGHETTASMLTWLYYFLAQHPADEQKLHEELASVLGGKRPTLEDLSSLKYTRMLMDETLRLRSPVFITVRDAIEDDVIAGYTVPKGSMVLIYPFGTHRHPDYWERPDEFYPDHFLPEVANERPRYAYYPFGAGPRICIGNHFALMEGAILIATISQAFRIRIQNTHEIGLKSVGVLKPSEPIIATVEAR